MILAGPNLVGQQARWLDFIGQFDFEITYRPVTRHKNVNALTSRRYRTCALCQSGVDDGKVEARVNKVVETRALLAPSLRISLL